MNARYRQLIAGADMTQVGRKGEKKGAEES
jgi:hypothetical protein